MLNPLKRQYVSDIDQLLNEFDHSNPSKSRAQQKEIAKHARIAQLRDHALPSEISSEDETIWEKF